MEGKGVTAAKRFSVITKLSFDHTNQFIQALKRRQAEPTFTPTYDADC
jgi:hypothetical protein